MTLLKMLRFLIVSEWFQHDGSVLTTNKLYWVNKTQKIKSDDFVHITTKNEDIQGLWI